MPTRTDLAVAAVCAAWAGVFLAGTGTSVVFAPLLGLAVLPIRRRPVPAALAVAALVLATFASGVSEESPATLAAGLTAAYALGRHARGLPAVAPMIALGLALAVVDGVAVADVAFVAFVLTATWTCGRLVRRRTEGARTAAETAAALAARDPAQLAARVVAEERSRLAGDALAVVRRSVEAMRRLADAAERDLDVRPLAAIQAEGGLAVTELRRLLGLLRAGDEDAAAPAPPAPRRRARRRVEAAVTVALVAACAVDVAAWSTGAAPGSIALPLAFAAAALAVRADASVACLLAALPLVAAATLDRPQSYGFATALAAGVLAWAAGSDGRVRALVSLGVVAAAALAAIRAGAPPGNEGILLAVFGLAALSGHVWGRRDREGRAAAAAAHELRARHAATAERAVREERLRLARELHDVASHAVGAMVLQAGAALAMRERDPGGARAAVRTVQAVGAEAIGELRALFGLLEAGAVGPPGLPSPRAEEDLAGALAALAERMRGGGLDVALAVSGPLPNEPAVSAATFRIVQEALTNAARHAPGSRVEVRLAAEGGALVVTVRDDGAGARRGERASEGGGFGLAGLAERARALGGELTAGPASGGGFAVSARLPVREPARVPA